MERVDCCLTNCVTEPTTFAWSQGLLGCDTE